MLLNMAARRAKPGAGSMLSEIRENRPNYGPNLDLPPMDDLPYVVVGGLAVALYMPPRATLDVDILVARPDQPRAEELLANYKCRRLGALSAGGSSWLMPDGRTLDVLALDLPWVDEALADTVQGPGGVPFIKLPYLILMKLESGRLQDLADISRMLGCAETEQIEKARLAVARFRLHDAEDFESMLKLGKMEHE